MRLTALATALACLLAPAAHAQTKVELDFPTWQAEEPGPAEFWTEATKAFEAAHPGVMIKKYQVPFREYVDKLTVRFAGGNPPDIVHLPIRNFASFASQGWLKPIDDLLAKTDIKQNFSSLQSELVWDGKTEGVLLLGYGMLLYYNEAMLKEAGVDVPRTPDELIKAIQAITKPDKGIFGWGATTSEHPNIFVDWASWVTGSGASLFTKDGGYNFTAPEVVKALDQFRVAVKNAPKGVSSEAMRQLYIDGKVAMFRDGAFFSSQIKTAPEATRANLKAAMMPFPVIPGGTSNSIHIPAKLDPQRQQLVWEFIEMISKPEWQTKYTQAIKVPAPRKGSFTPDMAAADPMIALAAKASEAAVNIFPTTDAARTNYNQIAKMVGESGMRLINSDRPTEAILKELQDQLNRRVPLK
ncbi:ABC transporter substrate-binding protein [Terrarubrum flagellatum]|uniref:ABC transporter substrate-binding protein n=1 Tax=Terrirubrum flagellatum TaxID=2895980 RepID=UPI003144E98F